MTTAAPRTIFADGRFLSRYEPARISLFDRGYLHGDAVFETLRTYRRTPFRLRAHLDRLLDGARILGIVPPLTVAQLIEVVVEAIDRTAADAVHIRITLSRGPGGTGVSTASCDRPALSVVARPLPEHPERAGRGGIDTSVVSARRVPSACVPSSFKSANYLSSVLARRELEARGQIEGVVLSVQGDLVGGTVSNLFLVSGGQVLTPGLESGCLPGITRAAVLELCQVLGIPAREYRLEPSALLDADEIFFTSSLVELLPVRAVAGRRLDACPGPVTRRLHRGLRGLIGEEAGR